jgi:hypothetical protein
MSDTLDRYNEVDARIERAKEIGWEAEQFAPDFWLMNDPNNVYSGIGATEYTAFADIVADPELWDEVTALLYPASSDERKVS